jgi:hypothetical protein
MKISSVLFASFLMWACQQPARVVQSKESSEKKDADVTDKPDPVVIERISESEPVEAAVPDVGSSSSEISTLVGSFATECVFYQDQPGPLDEYHQNLWVFRDDNLAASITIYAEGDDCDAGALFAITVWHAYAIGEAATDFPGAFVSGFRPVQVFLQPFNPVVVDQLEQDDAYGIKDWTINENHDITESALPNGAVTEYLLLKIGSNEGSVQFGESNSSIDSIPRKLLPTIFNKIPN